MSVILDSLRRARESAPARLPAAAPPRPAGIPAGLRVGGAASPRPKEPGGTRGRLIVGVVVAGVAIWSGLNFGLPLLQRRASAPRVVAITGSRPSAPNARPAAPAQPVPPSAGGDSSLAVALDKIGLSTVEAPRAMPVVRPSVAAASTPAAEPADRPEPGAARRTAALERVPPPRLPDSVVPAPPSEPFPVAAAPPAQSSPAPDVNHFDLAMRYQSLGNFEQALTHYSAVLQTQEFNVEARNNLGLLYLDRGLTTEAIDHFKRAILINPEYLKARSNLAVALMGAGRMDEARAELRAALTISPRNVDLLVNMALVEKGASQPEQAKETLLRALSYQPTHAAAHYNLAVLYDEAGDVAQAYDEYNDFLKNAGPEYGGRLSDVRRRVDTIAPKLGAIR